MHLEPHETTWMLTLLLSYFFVSPQKLLKTFGQTWWLCIPPRTLGVRPNFGIGFVQDGVCDDFSSTFYTATWHSRRSDVPKVNDRERTIGGTIGFHPFHLFQPWMRTSWASYNSFGQVWNKEFWRLMRLQVKNGKAPLESRVRRFSCHSPWSWWWHLYHPVFRMCPKEKSAGPHLLDGKPILKIIIETMKKSLNSWFSICIYTHLSLQGIHKNRDRDQHRAFEPSTSQVVSDPAVVRTELVADRWLRSTFDLPVQVRRWGWVEKPNWEPKMGTPWENMGHSDDFLCFFGL